MPTMTGFTTHCWKSALRLGLVALVACWVAAAAAGSIEPTQASVSPGDDGYTLSADFAIDLGSHLEDALVHGVTLTFNLEFTLARHRWYWIDEHVAGHTVTYRLSYNALTRQYRLSVGNFHQSFTALGDALHVLGRVGALPVAAAGVLKANETYSAALRLSLDKSQLPKPFQVDAIANPDWSVEAKVLRWQFTAGGEAK
jgi:hypothetical protein